MAGPGGHRSDGRVRIGAVVVGVVVLVGVAAVAVGSDWSPPRYRTAGAVINFSRQGGDQLCLGPYEQIDFSLCTGPPVEGFDWSAAGLEGVRAASYYGTFVGDWRDGTFVVDEVQPWDESATWQPPPGIGTPDAVYKARNGEIYAAALADPEISGLVNWQVTLGNTQMLVVVYVDEPRIRDWYHSRFDEQFAFSPMFQVV